VSKEKASLKLCCFIQWVSTIWHWMGARFFSWY